MKPLTRSQASKCEASKSPRCRCRCAGAFHGARRGELERLPAGDPHHVDAKDWAAPYSAREREPEQLTLWPEPRTNLERLNALRDTLAAATTADPGPRRPVRPKRPSGPSERRTAAREAS